MQIAAQFAFYQGALANYATAAQIAFGCQMHVATRPNGSTEAAGNFVVAQINVRAARRADRRSRRATDLLFSLTFETFNDQAALPSPEVLESAKDRGVLWRGRFFSCPQLQTRFRRKRGKVAAALTTDRAFGRCIFRLLEATVRAFHTDFCRRWIGHWMLRQDPFLIPAQKPPLLARSAVQLRAGAVPT